MPATRCTCVYNPTYRRIMADPDCPAYGIHVLNPDELKREKST